MGLSLFKKAKTEQFRPCLPIPQQNHAYRIIGKDNEASISAIPLTDMEAIELETKYINLILCKICSAFHNIMPPLSLDISNFVRNSSDKTYYEWCPHTPSGKAAKYPLVLHYHSVFVYNSAGSGESEDNEEYEAWLDYLDQGGSSASWERRIRIESPGSPQSYRRSLAEIAAGRAGLDKRRTNILARVRATGDFHRYERNSISIRDLAYLSAATGHEFALFRSKREDILFRGNTMACDVVGALGDEIIEHRYEWVAHSHVDGGKLTPSNADRAVLRRLKQERSVIVGVNGEEKSFGQSLFDP